MNVDVTAEPDEIVQAQEAQYNAQPIPVVVCGPVQTREAPAIAPPGYMTAQAVGTALGVRALAMEPRRKYATITGVSQDLWISGSQAGAQGGASSAMRWPAVVPYVVGHAHEVWVCSVAATTDVSIETVNWSE